MPFTRHLAVLAAAVGTLVALGGPAMAAGDQDGTEGTRVTGVHILSAADATLLPDVHSPEQLAASCPADHFCGYGDAEGYGKAWKGCGRADNPWRGTGWWINNLPGTRDRVAMFDRRTGKKSYVTPHSPSRDLTGDWTNVKFMQLCVA
ncbi:hypothetical protein GCM10022243_37330 [Saccharothrix violaceirubra]|uniref:Peptidase inhibitor family I36 n=1 Tax=Saccharothrix violaceirubra TaxID=413306 RepID=A0A7W7T4F7_9PSEU|nr:hypothetical protein [Saccharothrix violaceirubra]MBB4966351.1 hypothetical protein [Saccharothrix violaceirubra]